MRLIVRGIALAALALGAFAVSAWFFLYEQALHAQGVVVTARIESIEAIRRPTRSFGRSSVSLLQDKVRFSYTMPDGRRYVVAHNVRLDYSLAHKAGDEVKLRVDPSQPRKFEVGPKDFAGKGVMSGAVAMLLAIGAGFSFWRAYWRLLQDPEAARVVARPKARLRRVYMRWP